MSRARFDSILFLVRLLAGAGPVDYESPALTAALERLRVATSPVEIERFDRVIWRLWGNAGNRVAVRLLNRGLQAMASGDLPAALASLDQAIAADPCFAEAWNRRATIRFLMGEPDKSIADIARVLVLEPRHYGALSGLGQVLLQEGDADGALMAFEAALALNPHLLRIRSIVDRLRETRPDSPAGRPVLH